MTIFLQDVQLGSLERRATRVTSTPDCGWPCKGPHVEPGGAVNGFDPEHRYTVVPDLTVKWTNLPPKSLGHVRSYRGSPTSEPVESQVLAGREVVNNDRAPRNRTVDLRDLNDQFRKEGPYTIELVQETGPNTTILYQSYPLQVDRTSFPTTIFTGL